jgi:hypothetical protein
VKITGCERKIIQECDGVFLRRLSRADQAQRIGPSGSGPADQAHVVKARVIVDWQAEAAPVVKRGPCQPRAAARMTQRLPTAPSGNGPLTLIGAELQRHEESLCLLQQLKSDLHALTTALHSLLDGHNAPALKPLTTPIYRTLLGLASLRPPQPAAKPDDPVYEIGSAVKHLETTHLDDPHDTADALTQIESAIERIDALAADFCCDSRDSAAAHPLSRAIGALLGTTPAAPCSGDDALHLAKAVAEELRTAPSPIGTGRLLSAEA